jgi:hypothetical protein
MAGRNGTSSLQLGLTGFHQRLQAGQLLEVIYQGSEAINALLLHETQHRSLQGHFGGSSSNGA